MSQNQHLAQFVRILLLHFCCFVAVTVALAQLAAGHAGLGDVSMLSATGATVLIARLG